MKPFRVNKLIVRSQISFLANPLIVAELPLSYKKLSMKQGYLPLNYLGVPLFKGAPKRRYLQAIADKIISKFC